LYLVRYDYDICAYATVMGIIKVNCNLRLLDEIEVIGHNDAKIEWSSDKDEV